jgi:hypothetical protein
MYKIFRNIHLFLGLVITPFLLIYAFSALFFSFPFLSNKTVSSSVETFKLSSFPSGQTKLLSVLETEYDVRGEPDKFTVDQNGKAQLLISRPGSDYEISADPKTLLLTIKENTHSVDRFIKALHVSSGFDSKSSAERWWGVAVVIIAVMIVGIVVTGVILWAYNPRERKSGLTFIGLSFLYCTIVLAVLRFG